ncbi:branched-chain amino acid ABC transporter permease [Roseospira marina]|uniref:Branched-chain amino acid ABC transporter permease n=1 Tax=Roseospira marina TaxID=140057 RepID=A0A5M6ID17_9PROT|nr:branched-chain amino acid ABC transporter permease [Roseospira marina]KAA5606146.1 branched-chain amino acid ABC transporter permease [Roseospira marina]MBB4314285.1 branched-chain amino acid transport system permease protein [Roseospira marina]MBB5087445.1 branched-chain amino acid transport system permease protein [Roseospira marina]
MTPRAAPRFAVSPTQALALFTLLLVGAVVGLEVFGSGYLRTLAALTLINILLAVSLTMTNGFTGLFSLGHPAFMTLGAYVAVMFTYPVGRRGFAMPDLPDMIRDVALPLPAAATVGGLTAGLVAAVIGLLVLRLRTHYLAVATLGLIIVVQTLALNLDGLTRGGRGLTGIPREASLPLIALCTLLVVMLCWRIKHASIGRAMLAVRENEMAARCVGIHAFRLKMLAFVLGAALAGFGGALLPHVVSVMTPKSFGLMLSFNLVAIIVVGGQGSVIGAIVAALAISLGGEALRGLEETFQLYGITQVIVAVALIAALMWRPKGLFGLREPLVRTP